MMEFSSGTASEKDGVAGLLLIHKRGGEQWGAKWVRYGIGHPHEGR